MAFKQNSLGTPDLTHRIAFYVMRQDIPKWFYKIG